MKPIVRTVDILRLGAAGALVAVALVPYISVGKQPYAAIGFIERINALRGMQAIEDSWRVPAIMALMTSASALVAIALPRNRRNTGHVLTAALSLLSALLAYRLTGQSPVLHPLLGPKLLLVGAALSIGSTSLDLGATRLVYYQHARITT